MAVIYLRQEFVYDKETPPWDDAELRVAMKPLFEEGFEKVEQGLQLVKAEFEVAHPGCNICWERPDKFLYLEFCELCPVNQWEALHLFRIETYLPDYELFDDGYLESLLDDPLGEVIHEPLYSMDWSWLSQLNAELPDGQSVSVHLDFRKTVYNDRGDGLYTYHNEIVYP